MPYTKTIVCLAKSRKPPGRCVAGLEYDDGTVGDWIRPVPNERGDGLPIRDLTLDTGKRLELLDIVEITFLDHHPIGCQVENHVYDQNSAWKKVGSLDPASLPGMTDSPHDLWTTGTGWRSDRVATSVNLTSSLALVKAEHPSIEVKHWEGDEKPKVKIEFDYNDEQYSFPLTDPVQEKVFRDKGEGDHPLKGDVYVCASLGEPHKGDRFKFAAALFEMDKLK